MYVRTARPTSVRRAPFAAGKIEGVGSKSRFSVGRRAKENFAEGMSLHYFSLVPY